MNRRGMTIMELMIAMILSAIAFSLIWGTYSFYTQSIGIFSQRRERHHDMIYTVDFLCSELRSAKEILQITSDSCSYISSHGDSTLFIWSTDSLFRKREIDSLPLYFKSVDTLQFLFEEERPPETSGWVPLTIRAVTLRKQDNSSTYSRKVVIPYIVREEWF